MQSGNSSLGGKSKGQVIFKGWTGVGGTGRWKPLSSKKSANENVWIFFCFRFLKIIFWGTKIVYETTGEIEHLIIKNYC